MDSSAVQRTPVAIVGAGPTGVTAATLLAQYGIDSILIDRWPAVYSQPRAVHLDDEVARIVHRLGIGEQFAAISKPALGLRLLDRQHRVLAEFHRDTAGSRNGFAQANMFDQPALEELLRSNLGRYPRVRLLSTCEVTDVAIEAGRTHITAVHRGDGTEHHIVADYLLGCDGANSSVRDRIGTRMHDMNFRQRWLVADVVANVDLGQWEGVHQVCDPQRAGTYMQIGPQRHRWEFQLLDGESAQDFDTVPKLRSLIAPWTTGVSDTELELVRVTEYTFRAQLADQWRAGPVFLLGDAAHLTPPFIGQGLGAGLRDAMNLSWKLAGVVAGQLAPDVLDTYQPERRPHAHHMIAMALGVGRAMTAGGNAGDLVRRVAVPRMHLIPGLRAKITDSTTPRLHRSALVHRGRLAGRLCPNPLLDRGSRLDDVLGIGFGVVSTERPGIDQRELITRSGAGFHHAEPGSELAAWLRSGRATTAVVRPDRTVLVAGRDMDALCRALPTFITR